jgi:hypothetical protein
LAARLRALRRNRAIPPEALRGLPREIGGALASLPEHVDLSAVAQVLRAEREAARLDAKTDERMRALREAQEVLDVLRRRLEGWLRRTHDGARLRGGFLLLRRRVRAVAPRIGAAFAARVAAEIEPAQLAAVLQALPDFQGHETGRRLHAVGAPRRGAWAGDLSIRRQTRPLGWSRRGNPMKTREAMARRRLTDLGVARVKAQELLVLTGLASSRAV